MVPAVAEIGGLLEPELATDGLTFRLIPERPGKDVREQRETDARVISSTDVSQEMAPTKPMLLLTTEVAAMLVAPARVVGEVQTLGIPLRDPEVVMQVGQLIAGPLTLGMAPSRGGREGAKKYLKMYSSMSALNMRVRSMPQGHKKSLAERQLALRVMETTTGAPKLKVL